MALGMEKITDTAVWDAGGTNVETEVYSWASDNGGTVLNATSASEWYQVVNLQVSVDFHASATGDANVQVRKSADDGTTEDTAGQGTYLGTVPVDAGATVTKTFSVYDFDYLDVGIGNEDGTYNCVSNIIYEGVKLTGLT